MPNPCLPEIPSPPPAHAETLYPGEHNACALIEQLRGEGHSFPVQFLYWAEQAGSQPKSVIRAMRALRRHQRSDYTVNALVALAEQPSVVARLAGSTKGLGPTGLAHLTNFLRAWRDTWEAREAGLSETDRTALAQQRQTNLAYAIQHPRENPALGRPETLLEIQKQRPERYPEYG